MWGDRTIIAVTPLGAWLLVAPFTVYSGMLAPNFWNDVLIGAIVSALGLYGLVCVWRKRRVSVAAGWLVALLGLWQVTRPFVVATAGPLPQWTDAVIGVLLAFLGGRVVREARTSRREQLVRGDVGER